MAELQRIKTPWKQQWRRVRFQLVPVVSLVCCALLTGWLWSRRTRSITAIGEVQLVQMAAASNVNGMLVKLPGLSEPRLFDTVAENQVIAILDEGPSQRAIEVARAELERLKTEIAAKKEEIRLTELTRVQTGSVEARRLAVEVEELRLRILDRKAMIETDRVELQRCDAMLQMVQQLGSAASPKEVLEAELAKAVVEKRLSGNEQTLKEAEAQMIVALRRSAAHPEPPPAEMDAILQPIHAAILVQEKKIAELELQAESLVVKAPINGRISAIHRKPGEVVLAGEPIMTITSDHGAHVVGYIRQDMGLHPEPGMLVEVRSRLGGQPVHLSVDKVGSGYEQIPTHQARDAKVPEWGLPVMINLPNGTVFRPGELVEMKLHARAPALP